MASLATLINDHELLLRLASRRRIEVPGELRDVLPAAAPASIEAVGRNAAFYEAFEQLAALIGGVPAEFARTEERSRRLESH
jgi:hypothetical protein